MCMVSNHRAWLQNNNILAPSMTYGNSQSLCMSHGFEIPHQNFDFDGVLKNRFVTSHKRVLCLNVCM